MSNTLLTSLAALATTTATQLGSILSLGKAPAQRTVHPTTPVGAGFWAFQHTTSAAGIAYTKLVPADKSGPPTLRITGANIGIEPSIGSRSDRPSTRRARAQKA